MLGSISNHPRRYFHGSTADAAGQPRPDGVSDARAACCHTAGTWSTAPVSGPFVSASPGDHDRTPGDHGVWITADVSRRDRGNAPTASHINRGWPDAVPADLGASVARHSDHAPGANCLSGRVSGPSASTLAAPGTSGRDR